MPSSAQGSASVKNSFSMATASAMMSRTTSLLGRFLRREKSRQAKSVCMPSSREMSSLEKVRPGIRPRFLSQKMDANEPLKKIPSTAAKAIRRVAKVEFLSEIHRRAQSAFLRMQGTMRRVRDASMSVKDATLTVVNGVEEIGALLGLADVCVDQQRVGLGVDILHHDLEAVEASRLGYLYLAAEALHQVLVDNAVRGSEEGEDVRDEKAFVVVQPFVPVVEVFGEIDLFGGPERGFGLLVHLPDLI
jgi:hypothetical protein